MKYSFSSSPRTFGVHPLGRAQPQPLWRVRLQKAYAHSNAQEHEVDHAYQPVVLKANLVANSDGYRPFPPGVPISSLRRRNSFPRQENILTAEPSSCLTFSFLALVKISSTR